MPRTTFAGHALHPQLVPFAAGLLPADLIFEVLHLVTRKQSYADAGNHSMVGGTVGALVDGSAGAADYFTIPSGSPTKKLADTHATLNMGLVALYGVNLLLRRGQRPPTGFVPVLPLALGTTGLMISAWFGQEVVDDQGMRVRGRSPAAGAPEMRPGGGWFGDQFRKVEQAAPEAGPSVMRESGHEAAVTGRAPAVAGREEG